MNTKQLPFLLSFIFNQISSFEHPVFVTVQSKVYVLSYVYISQHLVAYYTNFVKSNLGFLSSPGLRMTTPIRF